MRNIESVVNVESAVFRVISTKYDMIEIVDVYTMKGEHILYMVINHDDEAVTVRYISSTGSTVTGYPYNSFSTIEYLAQWAVKTHPRDFKDRLEVNAKEY